MEQPKEGPRFSPFLLPVLAILIGAFFLGKRLLQAPPVGAAYRFDPRRIALEGLRPQWLQPSMAKAFFRSYLQASGESFPLLDTPAYEAWLGRLRGLPWVAAVSARRLVPNRVRLQLGFKRPRGLVFFGKQGWAFVSQEGDLLPGDQALLIHGIRAHRPESPNPSAYSPPLPGQIWDPPVRRGALPVFYPLGVQAQAPRNTPPDPGWSRSLREMALLATELQTQFLPRARQIASAFQVPGGLPPLLGISGGAPPPVEGEGAFETSDYYLLMRSRSGRVVWLAYGHAPGSPLAMIPWEEKALVLGKILRDHPGLHGLLQGDLRFRRYWKKHLRVPSASIR